MGTSVSPWVQERAGVLTLDNEVGWCRLTVSNAVLKGPTVLALEATM